MSRKCGEANFILLSQSSSDISTCQSSFQHALYMTNYIRPRLLWSGWPSVFLFSRVLEPPVPAWAYQADKNPCRFPRELWSCQALRALERIEAASQGLSLPYPAVQSQSQGQPGGHPREACQQHANPTHTHPSATSPGSLACFPSITIYTWQPGSGHNMKRILVICGRLLTSHGAECFFLTNSSLFMSTLLPHILSLLQFFFTYH